MEFPLLNFEKYSTFLKGNEVVVVCVTTWLDFKRITKTILFESHHANNIIKKVRTILKIDEFSFKIISSNILTKDKHGFDDKDILKNVESRMLSL